MSIAARLNELGLDLFECLPPIDDYTYVPFRRAGDLLFVSGQLPRKQVEGNVDLIVGKLGETCDLERGILASRLCGISLLSVVAGAIGSLDKVTAVVKVEGFVNCTDSFTEHSVVLNGCSDLLVEVFGQTIGSHARTAVGCSSLPKGAAVEVSAIFQIKDKVGE